MRAVVGLTWRRRVLAVTVMALAGASVLFFAGARSAPAMTPCAGSVLGGSNFEIDADANLKVDGPADCIDWLAGGAGSALRTGVLAKNDKPSGANDDSFGQGSQENDANPTIVAGSIPPNKSDLKTFGIYAETTATSKFLELFWSRVQDPSGTTNMDFELNQKFCDPAATPTNCANNGVGVTPETPLRTSGDKLITYDLSNGGTVPTVSIRTWTGAAWGAATDITASGQALGSVNSSTITAVDSDGLGGQDPFTFGEAAISFAALFPNPGQCGTLGSVYLKSRSSDSFQAELKDFVAPERVSISNCTTLTTTAQSSVTLGNPIFDVAHLSGATLGAGGTITFHLYSDAACLNAVATGLAPVPVNGNNDYNSGNFTPTAIGTYYWTATYSGDANNTGFTTACGDPGETSVVNKRLSSTATEIHNAAHQVVTVVEAGSTVHDLVTVAGQGGGPTPTGNVTIDWFTNSTCTNPVTSNSGNVALNASGQADATGFAQGPLAAGLYGFKAHYLGNTTAYLPSDGPCEPLQVVDANIQISPLTATNEVGSPHVFTAHVNVNDGSGWANAPVGTLVGFSKLSGPGTLSAPSCTTVAATGDCSITLSSATAGLTTLRASTAPVVGGLTLNRATGDLQVGDSADAVKTWVDANIQISPLTATNPLSTNHTLTGHVNVNTGTGGFVDAPNGTTISFSLTNSGGATASFVGPNSCTTSGLTGSCDVVINSSTAGTTTIKASTDVTVGGLLLHRETGDAKVGDSDDATKKWAAARISITPDATNEVGQPHTFVVTLEKDPGTGTYVAASSEDVDYTLTGSNGAAPILDAVASTCDDPGNNTDSNGQCTLTFTSNTAGKVTGHASATLSIGGATVTAATNGTGGSTDDAVKTFVDADIHIGQNGVNHVGQPHTFTAHVNVNDGTSLKDASGALVTFSIAGPGSLSGGNVSNTSCTTNVNGNCTIDLTSGTTGVTTVSAHTTLLVGGVSLARNTDGTAANSDPATKTWVNARISIAPDATNEIDQPHTFTVTLEQDPGTGTFVATQGEHVDFTLTNSNGATHTAATGTCTTANTDANGQCTITFTSPTPGKVTAHASSTLPVNGSVPFTVETDGVTPNGSDAVKTFVDANIQITPATATNPLSTNHTLTGHVNVNTGNGALANAPNGTTINFSLTNSNGATASFVGSNSCTTLGVTGDCDVVISSSTSGTTTINASTHVMVAGVPLHRATGDAKVGDGNDATKKWAAAKIVIAPDATHEVGDSHTFTVTLSKDTGTGSFAAADGEHVDFTLTDSNGAVHTAATGTCTTANTNASGQCTIILTSNTAGKLTAHASSTLNIGGAIVPVETDGVAPNSGNAVATFVDANIQITPPQATNPLNTNHLLTGHVNVNTGSGAFADAPAGTPISFSLVSGPASFAGPSACTTVGGSGSCTVTITSSTTGISKIRAVTDVNVGGVTLHRASGDGKAGDSADATKLWASAKIAIAPNATHEVGETHTFTVTLLKDTSNGTFVPAAGEHVDVALTDANGANHTAPTGTCTSAGANTNASGQCTIALTSSSAGTVTAHAASTLPVGGTSITVQTTGIAPNSGNAVATFVDANVQVTPATAINPISTNHTLTGHAAVNTGSGAFANAPDGTTINFSLTGPAAFVGSSSCTTSGGTGSCTAVISSSTIGTSTIKASTDVIVSGVTLHRESGDGKAGDSADASKLWADDTVRTDILNASGGVVTSVVAGTIVHDKVFVATAAGTPAGVPDPTGSVVFHRYATIDCTGADANQTVALTAGSPSTAVTDDFAPVTNMSYRADYLGDANYPARSGACEPLTVTPVPAPTIAIVKNPKAQTVAVGGTATFTITVSNAGNTVLTDVTVSDPLTPSCNRTKADIPALASMSPGASVNYSCSKTNVRASFDNVATAIGTPPSGPNVTATDTAPVKAAPLTAKKKVVKKKKKPKVTSHKKPKATG
jgi:uncharacterized repeat protein (TIGR01451 family)